MEEKERFEILLEHMDKNIQTVLEGHMSLKGEIEWNHAEAKELNRGTNLKLDMIAQTLADKIEKVDRKVEINRDAIELNRKEIVKNRDKIKDVDDKLSTNLENHEERIKVLEVIN